MYTEPLLPRREFPFESNFSFIQNPLSMLWFVLHTNTDHDSSAPYGNKSEIQEVLIEEQLDAWQATHFEEFLNHRIKGNIFRWQSF